MEGDAGRGGGSMCCPTGYGPDGKLGSGTGILVGWEHDVQRDTIGGRYVWENNVVVQLAAQLAGDSGRTMTLSRN